MAGWLAVLALLLGRKANRSRQGWALLAPLLLLSLALGVAERQLNGYLVFHYHQYICSAFADLLRYLSLSIALVLCFADALNIPWRWLRFLIVFLCLSFAGGLQIAANAWPMLSPGAWQFIFSIMVLLFLVLHSIFNAGLRRGVRADRFVRWYSGLSLAFGVLPLLVFGVIEWRLSQSVQLQSTQEKYRVAVVLASAVTLPWFVYFWFILLASKSELWRRRLARAFGVSNLTERIESGRVSVIGPRFEHQPRSPV